MKNHQAALTWLGLGLLTLTAAVSFIVPDDLSAPSSVAAEPLPKEVTLTGILRDFDTTHGDFDVVPTKGLGHYAGTVQATLGPDDLPEFDSDAGYKVAAQWTNADGVPIAPHLFQTPGVVVNGPAFFVDGDVSLVQSASIEALSGEAWLVTNSTNTGAVQMSSSSEVNGSVYAGTGSDPSDVVQASADAITGATGRLAEAFEMPTVTEPAGMGPSQGDKTYKSGTISGLFHADTLTLKGSVLVTGDTTILCDELMVRGSGKVTLAPGAKLDIYVRDAISLKQGTSINASGDPSRVTLYYLGSGEIDVQNSHRIFASVIAPEGHLTLRQSAQLTGSMMVAGLSLLNSAKLHMMPGGSVEIPESVCGAYEDTPGSMGVTNNGAISSPESFKQWFQDDLDANLSVTYPITLANDGSGNYQLYVDKEFYPLDDQGKGNEGDTHNSHFTYALTANFQHEACAGKYVEFQGGDGAWIFIDGRLAIDLGGVQTGQLQRFELDRFGLTDGETYRFDLFYANRNADGSTFGIQTNLLLWQDPVLATATNPFD